MSEPSWNIGDHLTHRFNPELGIGRVTALEARTLLAEFPRPGTTLRLAANTDALIPVDLSPGRPVRITDTREETTILARLPDGTLRLANGRAVSSQALWPLEHDPDDDDRVEQASGEQLEREVLGARLRNLGSTTLSMTGTPEQQNQLRRCRAQPYGQADEVNEQQRRRREHG